MSDVSKLQFEAAQTPLRITQPSTVRKTKIPASPSAACCVLFLGRTEEGAPLLLLSFLPTSAFHYLQARKRKEKMRACTDDFPPPADTTLVYTCDTRPYRHIRVETDTLHSLHCRQDAHARSCAHALDAFENPESVCLCSWAADRRDVQEQRRNGQVTQVSSAEAGWMTPSNQPRKHGLSPPPLHQSVNLTLV